MKAFSIYISKARSRAGLTQMEVAAELGYGTAQFISNWERGIAYPPRSKLVQLSTLYGVSAPVMAKLLLDEKIMKMKLDVVQAIS